MKFTIPSISPTLISAAAAAAKSLQSCPTLCDPIDSSPPGSSVHGIFQARTLEWCYCLLSHLSLTCEYLINVRIIPTFHCENKNTIYI